jgi:Flp pilus assembly protein TadG
MTNQRCRDRGTVLMLMPAAMVVLLVLASIMVDFTIVGMRSRELHNAASAAANDAATAALSAEALRTGDTHIDVDAARVVAARTLATQGIALDRPATVTVSLDGREVTVTLHATHDYLFAPVVPGAPDTFTVDVTATARTIVAGEQ